MVIILAVANFTFLQGVARRLVRSMERDMHFFQDKIACFDLPALDIDVHVTGMMVIEGATFTLSTLTIEAHSIEVALKVDDGLEICFRTEKAIARLGRCVEIGDVYVTLKTEMDTGPGSTFAVRRASTIDMMTRGDHPEHLNPKSLGDVVGKVTEVTDTWYPNEDEEDAIRAYQHRLEQIHDNTAIHSARRRVLSASGDRSNNYTVKEKKSMIASALQTATSITHPPRWSIAVSQLKANTPPWIHEFNNRFPVVQPQVPSTTSYDIIASIKTSTVQVFKVLVAPEIADPLLDDDDVISVDSAASNISSISSKSNISITIKDKAGIKQEEEKGISEVARISGVSATVEVPSLLLPHHEYLFPPPPASTATSRFNGLAKVAEDVAVHHDEDDRLEDDVLCDDFDGRKPAIIPNNGDRDEVIVLATILASLPAQFNSTILHFATALLKASKLIEIEKGFANGSLRGEDDDITPTRSRSLSRVGSKISATMKRTFTGAVDDAWLAKLVGKLVTKVEGLKGEVGYKMPIPVDLMPRRKVGLGPKGTAVDYGLFTREEVKELWPADNPYRRNC
ncbi:hypothetical protein ABW19_dt0200815 [Dactylella cylindrospora]|nr:hypothetical protein ABW19_dt0200815 [Dactylella cylindrospora]